MDVSSPKHGKEVENIVCMYVYIYIYVYIYNMFKFTYLAGAHGDSRLCTTFYKLHHERNHCRAPRRSSVKKWLGICTLAPTCNDCRV